MALRLSANHLHPSESGSESDGHSSSSQEEDEDLTWEDWVSDSVDNRPCRSLFDQDKTFTTVAEALNHDRLVYGVDVEDITARLFLDSYQRIRLINWIRKEKPAPAEVVALRGDEPFLCSDEYLIPALEDDPLLQVQSGHWSEEEWEEDVEAVGPPTDLAGALRRIAALEKKLQQARQDLSDYREFVGQRLNLAGMSEALKEPAASSSTRVAVPLRDDDSHYFQSYAENDIHAVMIQDKVRTATYAKFIQSSPELFKDAVVLDVGCGSGILSLFAARAGAKRVISVEASHIAEKAERIVKDNGLEDTITVVQAKVEDITLPDGIEQVDVIISEWMGYALLYESMLDSVLRARDRFLRPGGVMAPSQCKMMFALCEAGEIFKERVGFWSDVYGFDLSAMGRDVYEDAIVDIVGPETIYSEAYTIKDLYLGDVISRQLDFSTPFTLVSTAERRTKIHAFVLYFDVFFTATGEPIPPDTDVYLAREGDPLLAEVWPLGGRAHTARRLSMGEPLKGKGRPKVTSFSTGPASVSTHWKQTLFLLREPMTVSEGTTVQGTFKCRKSATNSRELDVEIHYVVQEPSEAAVGDAVVQMFKVR
ncbi:S-adenosyl-L-methionine-dependent methyltransferase [Sparassis latifolia]